jgi:pilus assembly protein Flp/PilA
MDSRTSFAIRSITDESGVTAIEYGLMAGLIALACIAAFSATGTSLAAMYTLWTNAVIAAL